MSWRQSAAGHISRFHLWAQIVYDNEQDVAYGAQHPGQAAGGRAAVGGWLAAAGLGLLPLGQLALGAAPHGGGCKTTIQSAYPFLLQNGTGVPEFCEILIC